MPIGARLVFPSIAPIGRGAHDDNRGVDYGTLPPARLYKGTAVVPGTEATQSEVVGPEVIYPRLQFWQIATNKVQIDMIERTGAGRGAKEDLASRIASTFGDAGG